MGKVLASAATTAFCSFLALIKFIGSGKLLQLSRLRSPALADPIPAVLDPPETWKKVENVTNRLNQIIKQGSMGYYSSSAGPNRPTTAWAMGGATWSWAADWAEAVTTDRPSRQRLPRRMSD
jgi:predicted Zn-dependent protease